MFTVGPQLLHYIGLWVEIPAACPGAIQLRSARAVDVTTWEVGYHDRDGMHTTCTAMTGATGWVLNG